MNEATALQMAAEERAGAIAKTEALDPRVRAAVVTIACQPSDRFVFAPWTYEVRIGGDVLAGRGLDIERAAERAAESLAEYIAGQS